MIFFLAGCINCELAQNSSSFLELKPQSGFFLRNRGENTRLM